ncbi:AraC family transcriptional regulator [Soehngenia saccharolytica]|nr:AraC family transcriptional regulator [Soehngenia saccharolytica]
MTEPFYFTRRFKEYFGISPREYILRVSDNDHSPEA